MYRCLIDLILIVLLSLFCRFIHVFVDVFEVNPSAPPDRDRVHVCRSMRMVLSQLTASLIASAQLVYLLAVAYAYRTNHGSRMNE